MVPFKEKLSLTFGLIEPRILVKNEIAKKMRKIRPTRKVFFIEESAKNRLALN